MALEMPTGDDVSLLTDWVELRLLVHDEEGMPLSRLDRLLRAEGSELADEELEIEEVEDDLEVEFPSIEEAAEAEVDVRVEQVRREIEERAAAGSRVYPFVSAGERLERRGVPGADVYRLLLVLGNGKLPYREQRRAHEVEEAFDLVALAALKRFLGRRSVGVRFARTARADDAETTGGVDPYRRPTSFPEAIDWLRELLELGRGVRPDDEPEVVEHWEDEGQEAPPLGRAPLTSYNDAGVDVVVWWKFADRRAGFPVLLAQCTVQLTWERKVRDIDEVEWGKWIDFDTVPPQKALVIPFADDRESEEWLKRTTKAGVIIDRVRLLELLDDLDDDALAALTDERVRDWTTAELCAVA